MVCLQLLSNRSLIHVHEMHVLACRIMQCIVNTCASVCIHTYPGYLAYTTHQFAHALMIGLHVLQPHGLHVDLTVTALPMFFLTAE